MEFPFDGLPGAAYIRDISGDIVPAKIREYQERMNVPCLDPLGCRFLHMCVLLSCPENIIDIGCGIGASTISMAMGAKDANVQALDSNIDRINACRELLSGWDNINIHHDMALPFLSRNTIKYDFAFVDTIKKDYYNIWCNLRDHLADKATIVFDDVLLHGYTAEEEATVPLRYRDGRHELRLFLDEMHADNSITTQIIPFGGGQLLVKLK